MQLKQVLVGLDGSAAAAAAARWAAEVVKDSGGEVVAVYGLDTSLGRQAVESASSGLGISPGGGDWKQEIGRVLEERWCQPLRESGVRYQSLLSEGDPVDVLLHTAREKDVDLIVVGHQGDTSFLHRLFKGLSDELLDHAKRPIVVVPFYASSAVPGG